MIRPSTDIQITILLAQQGNTDCHAELADLHRANPTPRTPNQRLSMALVRRYIYTQKAICRKNSSKTLYAMKRTYQQNNRLHGLLYQLGIDSETKEVLVSQFTSNRTQHSAEMTRPECQSLINHLQMLVGSEAELDRKRKRVIAHLAEAGYITGTGSADMRAIHEWVLKQKHKKRLNGHTSAELSDLIHAAKNVKTHYLQKLNPAS